MSQFQSLLNDPKHPFHAAAAEIAALQQAHDAVDRNRRAMLAEHRGCIEKATWEVEGGANDDGTHWSGPHWATLTISEGRKVVLPRINPFADGCDGIDLESVLINDQSIEEQLEVLEDEQGYDTASALVRLLAQATGIPEPHVRPYLWLLARHADAVYETETELEFVPAPTPGAAQE